MPWFPFPVVSFFTREAVLLFSDYLGVIELSIGVWNVWAAAFRIYYWAARDSN